MDMKIRLIRIVNEQHRAHSSRYVVEYHKVTTIHNYPVIPLLYFNIQSVKIKCLFKHRRALSSTQDYSSS